MIVYYLTPTKNVPGILKRGLQAGKSKGLTEILYSRPSREVMKEEKRTLYFAEDLESLGELIHSLSFRVRSPRHFTVLKVNTPESSILDPDYRQFGGGAGLLQGFLRSNIKRIPRSGVEIVGSLVIGPKGSSKFKMGTEKRSLIELGKLSSETLATFESESLPLKEEEENLLLAMKDLPSHSRAHAIQKRREEKIKALEDYFLRNEEQR